MHNDEQRKCVCVCLRVCECKGVNSRLQVAGKGQDVPGRMTSICQGTGERNIA